jgi:RNA 2',3'-cyclic 3'-phosphodiesterase
VRLFVAVYPPADVIGDLTSLIATLAIGRPRGPGESLRLVPPERLHVTLTFLGEVPDEREPAARTALAAATQRWARRRHRRPRLWLGGGGRFGRGRFTTVWTGVRGDSTALADIVSDMRAELRTVRLPFDAKAFRPHITLARPADRLDADALARDLAALDRYESPKWTVGAVDLVCSHPGPNIHYDRLAAFDLPDVDDRRRA